MTQTQAVERYIIVDGPSTDRLVDGYKFASTSGVNLHPTFTTEDGRRITVQIIGLAHESGADSHLFYGNVLSVSRGDVKTTRRGWCVRGIIHTHRRNGQIELSQQRLTF